jgi:hypothetical protein
MYNELIVIIYNFIFIVFAYLWLYPKLELQDINALSLYDLIVSLTTLIVGWVLFGEKEILFSLYFIDTAWYWYSITVYFILEIPFVLWYLKKYNIL